MPDGITSYRISAADCVRRTQTSCNSPDDRRKIFVPKTRCDGPRSSILPPRPKWLAVPSIAGDTVGTAPGDALAPLPSADNAAQPAIATIAGLPGSNPHCNSGSKDGRAESIAHTPSADNAATGPTTCDCYQRRPLDQNPNSEHAEMSPREVLLPTVKSRRRSDYSSSETLLNHYHGRLPVQPKIVQLTPDRHSNRLWLSPRPVKPALPPLTNWYQSWLPLTHSRHGPIALRYHPELLSVSVT